MTALSRRTIGWCSGVSLVALFALVHLVPRVDAVDRSASSGRVDGGTTLMVVERLALATIGYGTLAIGVAVLAVITARRQGVGPAARIVGSVVGAAASAELLKRVLPFDPGVTDAGTVISSGSFPSGHSAIAAALALAVATTLGPRLARVWWGPLVAWVSLVAAGTVAVGWHRPSDAVAGVLLAVVWHTALVRRSAVVSAPLPIASAPGGLGPGRSLPGWRWWAAACVAILVGALAPRAGGEVELREATAHLYVLGLVAVLATTGALMLVTPDRVPPLRHGTE